MILIDIVSVDIFAFYLSEDLWKFVWAEKMVLKYATLFDVVWEC